MSTTAEREKVELAVKMRKLISPMFQQAVEDALATQDVCAFWEEIDAAIITGMEQYAHSLITSLAEEAEREAAGYSHEQERHVVNYGYLSTDLANLEHNRKVTAAWLRQKAEERG
jgi:hypothetical protein